VYTHNYVLGESTWRVVNGDPQSAEKMSQIRIDMQKLPSGGVAGGAGDMGADGYAACMETSDACVEAILHAPAKETFSSPAHTHMDTKMDTNMDTADGEVFGEAGSHAGNAVSVVTRAGGRTAGESENAAAKSATATARITRKSASKHGAVKHSPGPASPATIHPSSHSFLINSRGVKHV
jgi:hypothetical protein